MAWIARQGRWALLIGLALGIGAPGLAALLRPWITPLILSLLFLAILRLGPEGLRAGLARLPRTIRITLVLQLLLPAIVAVLAQQVSGALILGATLMLASPPLTGSPHMAVMVGADPAPALRQMVVGTALLPLTVLPVFWLLPVFGTPSAVLGAVVTLLAMLGAAGGAALLLRVSGLVRQNAQDTIDALAAIGLGAVVIGIMSAVGPALHNDPLDFAFILIVAFALNLALQVGAWLAGRGRGEGAALGIVSGNRNIVLLLGVLPGEVAAEVLLFVGAYQMPMYLTPILLRPLYKHRNA